MRNLTFFVHPVPLSAVALMAVNDHYLKYEYANWWTGKLSDFAGVFFFPLFLTAVILLGVRRWQMREVLPYAILATDIGFAAIKIWPAAARIAEVFLGSVGFPSRIISDPTDLWALTMNPLTYLFAIAVERRSNT